VLEKEKRTATRQVFKAVEDIKSGEKITEEKVVRAEVFSEMEKTLYMTEEGIGKVSRIDISAGTFITDSMVYSKGEAVFSEVGYRNINVQGNISEEDFIDVRIFYPNGEDMKVLSGKRVEGIENASVIYMRLTEEEMLMMASAITDISCMGAELYTVKCCMPGECEGEVNYLPSEQVLGLIEECTGEDFITDKAECIEKRRQLEKRVLGG